VIRRYAGAEPFPIAAGMTLRLAAEEWKYGDGPLVLRVDRIRWDLSRYYDDEVWLTGHRLDANGIPTDYVQALVRVAVLRRAGTGG
jgi:hypothetical protein